MPNRNVGDHEKHHDIDARVVLQLEAGLRDPGPGVDAKGECPAVSLEVEPGLFHESAFLIEFSPPQRLTAVVSISNKSSTRPKVWSTICSRLSGRA